MATNAPLGELSNLNIGVVTERGVATIKSPYASPAHRRHTEAKASGTPKVRQKASGFSKTTAATAQEIADGEFLEKVSKGELDLVSSLIDGGQDVNVADERGDSALHKAVATYEIALVRKLLLHKVIVDHPNVDGTRAIGVAIKLGLSDIADLLIDAGADLRWVNPKDGSLLLHEACWAGHIEMVDKLLATDKYCDLLETVDNTGRTPLHVAAFRAPEACCRALIAAGANPGVMDKRLNTPSTLAGRVGRRNSKDFLLSCEASMAVALAATKLKRMGAARQTQQAQPPSQQ